MEPTWLRLRIPFVTSYTLFLMTNHAKISRKGISQPLSKHLHLMTPLKASEIKGCIIFIYSTKQRSPYFPSGRSKSFLMLESTHEDLCGNCRNSQPNFGDKVFTAWVEQFIKFLRNSKFKIDQLTPDVLVQKQGE